MWSLHANARCIEFEPGPGRQRFIGEHDGYTRFADPVAHRRQIDLDPEKQLIEVSDTLRCTGSHLATRAWHFAENCQVEQYGAAIRVTDGFARVHLEPMEPVDRVEIHVGGSPMQGGWISRTLGRKERTTSVLWHSSITGVTVLQARIRYTRSHSGAP